MEHHLGRVDYRLGSGRLGRLLGVSRQTIRRWIDGRALPARRTRGGRYRFDARSVVVWLRSRGLKVPAQLVAIAESMPPLRKANIEETDANADVAS